MALADDIVRVLKDSKKKMGLTLREISDRTRASEKDCAIELVKLWEIGRVKRFCHKHKEYPYVQTRYFV